MLQPCFKDIRIECANLFADFSCLLSAALQYTVLQELHARGLGLIRLMDGKGLGGTTLTPLSFLKQSLTPAIDGSPYDDKMEVSAFG